MKRVIIESPYAGNTQENLRYLRAALAHSLSLGEAPFASHAIYTQEGVLDDTKPEQRKQGIEAGFSWWEKAELIVFYVDLGWSRGMEAAYTRAVGRLLPREVRFLPGGWNSEKGHG